MTNGECQNGGAAPPISSFVLRHSLDIRSSTFVIPRPRGPAIANCARMDQDTRMHSPLQEIVALLGYPVAGNPTQYMVERALSRIGLDWRYLTLEVAPENLADAVRGMRAMGFRGGNFTMPHKVAVLPLLDELTEAARLMGAVNCWWRHDDRLLGDNTDGKGFLQSLRGRVDPAGRRFAILGAGGAARAIAVELALAGGGRDSDRQPRRRPRRPTRVARFASKHMCRRAMSPGMAIFRCRPKPKC